MSRKPLALLAAAVMAALAPGGARAHGVVTQIERRNGAVSVRLRYHDGPPLAGAMYEVRSPRGGDAPFAEGRTDRHGWVAFTPDVTGTWRVRIADATGHGRVVDVVVDSVEADRASPAAAAPAATIPAAAPLAPPGPAGDVDPTISRIVAGAAAIAAAFGVLFAVQRARRRKGP